MKINQLSASLLLPACLALAPLTASAEGIDGGSAGNDPIIDNFPFDPLVCVDVTTANNNRVCAATCSAEANNPVGPNLDMDYRLAVTNGAGTVIIGGSERKFEFVEDFHVDEDIDRIEVSTTAAFEFPENGVHRICCSAAKVAPTDVDMLIQDSSMSIVCSDGPELDPVPDLPDVLD